MEPAPCSGCEPPRPPPPPPPLLESLEALKELGQPALEPEELPLDSRFFMAPLSSLDLLKPGGEAQALQIIDWLECDFIAHCRSSESGSYPVLAVPTSGWPHLAINWTRPSRAKDSHGPF